MINNHADTFIFESTSTGIADHALSALLNFPAGSITVICTDSKSGAAATILPFCASTIAFAIDSPNPYPPFSEFLDCSVL